MANAQSASTNSAQCAIHGITKDADGKPVAGVEVSVHNLDDQSDPAILSGADGSFALLKIKPGKYEVIAARDGFQSVTVNFNLAAGDDHPLEFVLARRQQPLQASAAIQQPVSNAAPAGFWKRFAQAYKDDWHPAPAA